MFTLYTLTSYLHSEAACRASEEGFIREIEDLLGEDFDFRDEDFSGYGETLNNVIYVRPEVRREFSGANSAGMDVCKCLAMSR